MNTRACSVEGCDRPHRAKGYCGLHYFRVWKHGDPTVNLKPGGRICTVEDCDEPYHAHGYCVVHASRVRRTGSPFVVQSKASGRPTVNNPGYIGVHARMHRATKANRCAECGAECKTHMALIPGRGNRADITGSCKGLVYSLDPADYQELCPSCHRRQDIATRKAGL